LGGGKHVSNTQPDTAVDEPSLFWEDEVARPDTRSAGLRQDDVVWAEEGGDAAVEGVLVDDVGWIWCWEFGKLFSRIPEIRWVRIIFW